MQLDKSNHRVKAFVGKLTAIVQNNLSDDQFGVEALAKAYGLSRSQLFKKLKKTTGRSISQFISEVRLAKALELLRQEDTTVSEVAYKVGFGSPIYFTSCFKKRYGCPPSSIKNSDESDFTPLKRKKYYLLDFDG